VTAESGTAESGHGLVSGDSARGATASAPCETADATGEGGGPEPIRPADFDYDLPPELIAQVPSPERDAARLLVLERGSGAPRHALVRDLPQFLRAGDLLVMNDARVRPARLRCRAVAGGGPVELLLLAEESPRVWSCLGRPAKRLRAGTALALPGDGAAVAQGRLPSGRWAVEFDPSVDVSQLLARYGELPLPPYIKRYGVPLPLDRERYQTIYASREVAVAAPTAGLHFTPALLAALDAAGVQRATLTLAVGPSTFLPVRAADAREHALEGEWVDLAASTVAAIERTKAVGGRVIAVGTTTTRALESAAQRGTIAGGDRPVGGAAVGFWAEAFILPGFPFRVVDALLTNFHLPRSTLLMLVSAFAGRERALAAYATAVREGYRFYSYGDAMLIC
jgi:S-adenosylmethionine:tRNA ribosyltransferase-isomerase